MYTSIDFDPFTANPDAWEQYLQLMSAGRDGGPGDEPLPLTNFRAAVREQFKRKSIRGKLIYKEGTPVLGIQCFSKTSADGALTAVIVFEGVVDEISGELRNEINSVIAEFLQLVDPGPDRSFLCTSKDRVIWQLLESYRGALINTICYFRLLRRTIAGDPESSPTGDPESGRTGNSAGETNRRLAVNAPPLAQWLANKDIESGELTVAFHEYVPERLYDSFAALMTELMNDIIREDSQEQFSETAAGVARKMELFKKTHTRMLLFLLLDCSGQLIGLSFVLVDPHSAVAKQEMTGVRREYRGRKLAYYLKALAIRETLQRFPHVQAMETNCYSINEPIIHVNRALGYEPTDTARQYRVYRPKMSALNNSLDGYF
ncbi:MAG: hypothetical protein P4L51_01005 [Puia sp.]|nr:hypothetical protein [Puia sp.]